MAVNYMYINETRFGSLFLIKLSVLLLQYIHKPQTQNKNIMPTVKLADRKVR